ncbi:hypothetical protein Tco_0216725 [Tanacetum coccineum]
MSFSKRSDTALVCYTKPLDSLKHWYDSFLWVDASAFPFSLLWHNNKTLRKDPHPLPNEFDVVVCDFLATHTTLFWKFSEPFLCFIGISRYYEFDDDVYLVFLIDDDEGGCSLFASCEKPIKEGQTLLLESTRGRVVSLAGVNDQGIQNDDVQDAGNQNDDVEDAGHDMNKEGAADGSRKKRKTIGGASGSTLPPKKLKADHGTSGAGASTGGKFVAALHGLLKRSTFPVKVGVTTVATLSFITSSVSLTPKREGVAAHILSNATDAEVSSVVMSLVLDPPIMTTAIATTDVAAASSVLVPRMGYKPVHASIFVDSTSAGTVGLDIAGPSQPTSTEFSTDTFYVSQDMDSKTLHQIYVPK